MNFYKWKESFLQIINKEYNRCYECNQKAKSACPVTSFVFCSTNCQQSSFQTPDSVYKYVLISGGGKKRKQRDEEEDKDKEEKKQTKLKLMNPEEHGNVRMNVLLRTLKDNPGFLETLIRGSTPEQIQSWSSISKAFRRYISNNDVFWYLYLKIFYADEYPKLQLEKGYFSDLKSEYIKIGRRKNNTVVQTDRFLGMAKHLLQNDEGMKTFLENVTKQNIVYYLQVNPGFKELTWNNNKFWYYVAKKFDVPLPKKEYDFNFDYKMLAMRYVPKFPIYYSVADFIKIINLLNNDDDDWYIHYYENVADDIMQYEDAYASELEQLQDENDDSDSDINIDVDQDANLIEDIFLTNYISITDHRRPRFDTNEKLAKFMYESYNNNLDFRENIDLLMESKGWDQIIKPKK